MRRADKNVGCAPWTERAAWKPVSMTDCSQHGPYVVGACLPVCQSACLSLSPHISQLIRRSGSKQLCTDCLKLDQSRLEDKLQRGRVWHELHTPVHHRSIFCRFTLWDLIWIAALWVAAEHCPISAQHWQIWGQPAFKTLCQGVQIWFDKRVFQSIRIQGSYK